MLNVVAEVVALASLVSRQTFPQVTFLLPAAGIALKIRFDTVDQLMSAHVLFICPLYVSQLPGCVPKTVF